MRTNFIGMTSLLAGVLISSSVASGSGGAGTRGFVVTAFAPAIHEADDACPEGLVEGPDTQAILAALPRAERVRLLRPEHSAELMLTVRQALEDASTSFKTVKGKRSYGLDLDGSDGKTPPLASCPHESFVGPGGEPGIDNQWYRAIGCMKESHPGGLLHEYFNASMRKGDFAILIEINGIDDPANDAEVQVGFYRAANPLANAGQTTQGKARMQVYYDNYFHGVSRGRIVDGVLTTEPVDMRFKAPPEMRELVIRDARVKMEFQPSGRLAGILGGYQEAEVLHTVARSALHAEKTFGPLTCRCFHPAVASLSDGYPDPEKDGPCDWISVAYEVEASPATLIHSSAERRPAAKQAAASESCWQKLLWWRR
jgi:hypothetical protein